MYNKHMLIPAALAAAAVWGIVRGIDVMAVQESNNRFHAVLLGCAYMGKPRDFDTVLYFDCAGRIELHREIAWTDLTQ